MKNPLFSLLLLAAILPFSFYGQDLPGSAVKRLYLTSAIGKVIDELVPLLPFEPNGHVACYISTASKHADWNKYPIRAIENAGFEVKQVDLADLSKDTIADDFKDCDIIFVGGGNTMYLLQEVRRSGFDELVERMLAEGVPYVGGSAGSVLVAPNIECVKFADDPAEAPNLTSFDGLNLFPLVTFVHFDQPQFKEAYEDIPASNGIYEDQTKWAND